MSTNMSTDVVEPSAPPPGLQQGGAGSVGMTEPSRPPEQTGGASTATMARGLPTMQPPAAAAGGIESAGAVTATWQTGQVTGLWAINEPRNAWLHANGAWRRIYNGRDWAFTALVTLASQARATGRTINYRQESDGMVYEIYLW